MGAGVVVVTVAGRRGVVVIRRVVITRRVVAMVQGSTLQGTSRMSGGQVACPA